MPTMALCKVESNHNHHLTIKLNNDSRALKLLAILHAINVACVFISSKNLLETSQTIALLGLLLNPKPPLMQQ